MGDARCVSGPATRWVQCARQCGDSALRLVRRENMHTLPASDWSVMRICLHFMRLIGPLTCVVMALTGEVVPGQQRRLLRHVWAQPSHPHTSPSWDRGTLTRLAYCIPFPSLPRGSVCWHMAACFDIDVRLQDTQGELLIGECGYKIPRESF